MFAKSRPAAAVSLLLVLALWPPAGSAAEKPDRPKRIAVLPMKNLRPSPQTDWIGEGAAETLTTKLGEVPQLITVERAQVRKIIEEHRFQAAMGDPGTGVKVGRLVAAERVVLGTHASSGGTILFNVRVVDVKTGVILNRAALQTPEAKIFDGLFKLAEAVVKSFEKKVVIVDNRPSVVAAAPAERVVLTARQLAKLRHWGTTNPAAHRAFSMGCAAKALDRKIQWYTRAIALDTTYAWAYNLRGYVYTLQARWDLALADCTKALALDSTYVAAYSNRAVAYNAKGEYDKAIRDCDRAIALNPHFPPAHNNRGVALVGKRLYGQAIQSYQRAIRLSPRYAVAYSNLGVALQFTGNADAALAQLSKAVEFDPTCEQAYSARGWLYFKGGQLDLAVADLTRLIRLNPGNPSHYGIRGTVYVKTGRYDLAIADFTKVTELVPRAPGIYGTRARAYYLARRYDKAWADVKKCQALGGKIPADLLADLRKAAPRGE